MHNFQRQLQNVATMRRRELLPYVFEKTGGKVQIGPFKDLIIVPRTMWGDGDTAAKLMGVYEDELHDYIEQAISSQPDSVINIGSAEGYYSTGFAQRLPDVQVLAVDIDPRAGNIVAENASANGQTNVVPICQLVDVSWLAQNIVSHKRPLLILDCEGAELDLLDLDAIPDLAKCSILVECHDCIKPGITKTLTDRFQSTHHTQVTPQKTKDPYQFHWCDALSDCDKWALVQEGRPSTMTWLYMVPKS